jgi:hypothetical protein
VDYLTKTDDNLLELNRTVPMYMREVRPFQYKNKTYRLIDNYVAVPYMKCDVCGDYPTFEVSIIESEDDEVLHVGNDCMDRLTGRSVSEWFRSFRRKREGIIANRKYIDQLSLILNPDDCKELFSQITEPNIEKLRVLLEQMNNGEKLTTRQEQIADGYMSIKVTA